mgnify:CR=1 FL=1|jgi:hypothetical protein
MIMIDLTGTHEEAMTEINNAPISDEFKAHIRKELQTQIDKCLDLDIEHEENGIPIHELVPKGMTIKEYFGREQRLLRGENISYMKFD